MADNSTELLDAVREIRELLRLVAEPAIAARDAKLRTELRKLVGNSEQKRKSVFIMDGTRTQTEIRAATGVHQGNLSTLVKQMNAASLIIGDTKYPKLAISIPSNFFETDTDAE